MVVSELQVRPKKMEGMSVTRRRKGMCTDPERAFRMSKEGRGHQYGCSEQRNEKSQESIKAQLCRDFRRQC